MVIQVKVAASRVEVVVIMEKEKATAGFLFLPIPTVAHPDLITAAVRATMETGRERVAAARTGPVAKERPEAPTDFILAAARTAAMEKEKEVAFPTILEGTTATIVTGKAARNVRPVTALGEES